MKSILYLTKQRQLFNSDEIEICHDVINTLKTLEIGTYQELAIDIETTGLNWQTDKILLIALATKVQTVVVDCTTINPAVVITYLQLHTRWGDLTILGHNLKFDIKFLRKHTIKPIKHVWDTFIVESVLTNGLEREKSLKALVSRYLGISMSKDAQKSFIGMKDGNFTTEQILYAATDVEHLFVIKEFQAQQISQYELKEVVHLENACVPVYAEIEVNGFYLNKDYYTNKIITYYKAELVDVTKRLNNFMVNHYKYKDRYTYIQKKQLKLFEEPTGENEICIVNWSSNKQVLAILKTIGCNVQSIDKEHNAKEAANDAVLTQNNSNEFNNANTYQERKDTAKSLTEFLSIYREVSKIVSTYGESFLEYVSPIDGRIHPDFYQLGAETGRVSCNNPNLQNIPADNLFRNAFQAENGNLLLIADYSGAELRIIAEGSQDPTMIEAFNNGEDVHSTMATFMNGVEVTKKVNKHLRDRQKTINFGLAYGAGPEKFKGFFNGDVDKADEELKKFFFYFPKIKKFLDGLSNSGIANKYIRTFKPFQRIRWFDNPYKPDDEKNYKAFVSKMSRQSKNTPIQGTSADITKAATVMIQYKLWREKDKYAGVKLVNQVHDEIVIEFNPNNIDKDTLKDMVTETMVEAGGLSIKYVTMEAEVSISKYWEK